MATYEELYKNSIPSLDYVCELTSPNIGFDDYLKFYSDYMPGCKRGYENFNALVDSSKDYALTPQGWEILQDRFLLKDINNTLIESPKHMIARVANSLADTEREAIEFFTAIYNRKFMPSSPILFNAGTSIPQLSSCYIHTVSDSIDGIFKSYHDMALMGKYSGGIATDWTYVRGIGAFIRGTGRTGQGLIPWLKIQDSVALAVNQGGRRNGAHCAYLEVWHSEIFEFVKLRKQIGDENRLTHHLHTAVWIPDKFMEAVVLNDYWYLFCPSKAENLHELTGIEFSIKYNELVDSGAYEQRINARDLWQHILTNLFETGHPWITFKDACNRGNFKEPILSSNLCTEITLPTAFDNTAVCTLSSLNLANLKSYDEIRQTAQLAARFLNRIIDKSWYPTPEAKYHAKKYRPLGLGVMGYQDALQQQVIVWGSDEHKTYDQETFQAVALGSRDTEFINDTYTAIAPTATISHIVGVCPSIEPYYAIIYSIEGLSGTFMVANPQWLLAGQPMNQEIYKTAFELDQNLLIEAAARRQKYICQSQSLNLYVNHTDGKQLSEMYVKAWKDGLKTTYYLRTVAASKAEGVQCSVNQSDCESCQ